MNIKEFAETINGREYGYEIFSKEEIEIAKQNGFLIVYGASDDLMELDGAIYDEAGVFDGGIVHIKVVTDEDGNVVDGGILYENYERSDVFSIKAKWCEGKDENGKVINWTYETSLPHETFKILEDGKVYCVGLVIDL